MFPYLIIGLTLLFLSYKYDYRGYVKNKVLWQNFILSFMIAIVGLRYHIGSDTVVYEWNFNTSYTPDFDVFLKEWREYNQPLWMLIMSFCKTYFNSFVAVQFFHAIVYNIFLMRFIKKMTRWQFTALFIAFSQIWFANSFEVLRESISAVIYMNALLLLHEKKYLKYFVLGIIATCFHSFAFIIFLLTPIVVKLNYAFLLVIYVLIFIIVRIIDVSFINNVLTIISAYMSDSVSNKMSLYIGQEDATVISFLGLLRSFLLSLLLPLFVLKYTDSNMTFYKKLVLLWMIFSSMTVKMPILYRMENYLTIVYIVLLVNMICEHKIPDRNKHVLSIILLVSTVLMNFRDLYRPDRVFEHRAYVHHDCRYFPYKTIFQEPDPIREGVDYY